MLDVLATPEMWVCWDTDLDVQSMDLDIKIHDLDRSMILDVQINDLTSKSWIWMSRSVS